MSSSITLSPDQQAALDGIVSWYDRARRESTRENCSIYVVGGYAGSGKSTLIGQLHDTLGLTSAELAAYTGKAALVMSRSAGLPARTLHNLIYLPKLKCERRLDDLESALQIAEAEVEVAAPKPTPEQCQLVTKLQQDVRAERDNLNRAEFNLNLESDLAKAELLIVDEAFMIGQTIGYDLASFGCPILAFGDPGQLPPIKDRSFFSEIDVKLEKIHRQAADNPIIGLAHGLRKRKGLPYGDYGAAQVRERGQTSIVEMCEADQIIVGLNATKRHINHRVRQHRGFKTPIPEAGERIICRKNDGDRGLLNGSQWRVQECEEVNDELLRLTATPDDGCGGGVFEGLAWRHYFEGREQGAYLRGRETAHFDFAYAITCHRAQGSQWDKVIVMDESVRACRESPARWLYTAITRAAKELVVIR